MLTDQTYDLSEFGPLSNAFIDFHDTMEKFSHWLEESEGMAFKNFVKSIDLEQEGNGIANELSNYDKIESTTKIFEKLELEKARLFGRRIHTYLYTDHGLEYTHWEPETHKIRELCITVFAHIDDFFIPTSKQGRKARPQARIKLMKELFDDIEENHALFELFSRVLLDICNKTQTKIVQENEDPLALAARCLELHVGSKGLRMRKNNEILKRQIETILWKDYVPSFVIKKRERVPAIDELIKFREHPNRNCIQILGEGGLGKTKLVIEFIKKSLEEDNGDAEFDSVLMLTAKSDSQGEWSTDFSDFTKQEDLPSPRDPTLAFGHYISGMDFEETMEYIFKFADVTLNSLDAMQNLERAFRNDRLLIILDNFEDANEKNLEKFESFFEEVMQFKSCRSKIIVTGRTKTEYTNDVPVLELQRLSDTQAVELMGKRYQYEFERYYAGGDDPPNRAIFDDFRSAIGVDLITNIRKQVEKVDKELAAHFADGILHPGVLFYFISMLMDGLLVDEYKEKHQGSKPDFIQIFTYGVCHEQYGVRDYLESWEKWIKDKTTLYVKNDEVCMRILKVMAESPDQFFSFVLLFDGWDHEQDSKQTVNRAFEKLQSHQGILECHLELGTYRISREAINLYGLDTNLTSDFDITKKVQSLVDDPESLAMELPGLIDSAKPNIHINEFHALVHAISEVSKNPKCKGYHESSVKKMIEFFPEVYAQHYPSNKWTINELRELLAENSDVSSNILKEQLLKLAKQSVNENPKKSSFVHLSNFSNSNVVNHPKLSTLPAFVLDFLSILPDKETFFQQLTQFPIPNLEQAKLRINFREQLSTLFINPDHDALSNDALTEKQLLLMMQFCTLISKDIERLADISCWFIHQLNEKIDFSNKEDVQQFMVKATSHMSSDESTIRKNLTSICQDNRVRTTIQVNPRTVAMYDYFDSIDIVNIDFGMDHLLEESLPFTEIRPKNNSTSIDELTQNLAHKYYSAELEIDEYNPNKRCILMSSVPALKMFRYIQLERKEHSVSVNEVDAGSDSTDSSESASSANGEKPSEAYERFVTELSVDNRNHIFLITLEAQASSHSLEDLKLSDQNTLQQLLDAANAKKETANPWLVKFSPYRKDFITAIERKRIELYPTNTNNKSKEKFSIESVEWFERKKAGMLSDIAEAEAEIRNLEPELKKHMKTKDQETSPVTFANKFVKKFQRPYSKYKNTSMRWYAAFGSFFTNNVDFCSIMESYDNELTRQLKISNKSSNQRKNIMKFCDYWLSELRSRFGCPTQTNAEKKAKKIKDRNERRRQQEVAEQAAFLKHEQERKRRKQEKEERQQKAELLRQQQAEENKKKNLQAFLEDHHSSSINHSNLQFILHAMKNARQILDQYDAQSMRFSAWFSKCYQISHLHASWFLNPNYALLLAHIESKIFLIEYSPREIIESYLKSKGFENQRIEKIWKNSVK